MRYAANPFVEVIEMEPGTWSLQSPGNCSTLCYLVEGADKALLIDTGFGVGDMKALCEFLAPNKELICVITHSHFDHILGNFQFDKVYVHENDLEDTRRADERIKANGQSAGPGYTAEDCVPYKDYELVSIREGYVFDLGGGHELEVIHTPGHTPGGICLLEKKRRMLFTGDSLVRTPTLIFFSDDPLCNVQTFGDYLRKLALRKDEFDALYPGHNLTPQPVEILDDMIELCDIICKDPLQFEVWGDGFGERFRARLGSHKKAFIAYNESHTYKPE